MILTFFIGLVLHFLPQESPVENRISAQEIMITRDIRVENYFNYIDSLVIRYDSLVNYQLTEHILIRHNSWIIDTLANTDYYRMLKRDSVINNQRKMIILQKGQILKIPDEKSAAQLISSFNNTVIDINIPEFILRIYQDSVLIHTAAIRVGQNSHKYLEMNKKITDLRTKHGEGTIIRHIRDPYFYNPTDGKQFYFTRRDDDRITLMPKIPWIETEINGIRNGQMIHPTTNPNTLRKAYSNGCIGTSEADAWRIYYYAPIGTKVHIRYDLKIKDEEGKEKLLEDIYTYRSDEI